jgi:hypothetical protein
VSSRGALETRALRLTGVADRFRKISFTIDLITVLLVFLRFSMRCSTRFEAISSRSQAHFSEVTNANRFSMGIVQETEAFNLRPLSLIASNVTICFPTRFLPIAESFRTFHQKFKPVSSLDILSFTILQAPCLAISPSSLDPIFYFPMTLIPSNFTPTTRFGFSHFCFTPFPSRFRARRAPLKSFFESSRSFHELR